MRWKKLGLVYQPKGDQWWARSHAMIPTPVVMNDDVLRVFISCCDDRGVGRVGYVDVDAHDPTRILDVARTPVLDIGDPGAFDDHGAVACSVLTVAHQQYLYYVGFELGVNVRYRLLTGLAYLDSSASSFQRNSQTPILERSDTELLFRCGPFVMQEDIFRMWYVAGSGWEQVNGATKPVYEIRYMESNDGIHWPDCGSPCISIAKENEHGFGRPYVVRDGDLYRMFYSVRRRDVVSYRLGYAESQDGRNWLRKDDEIGLDVSAEGWDSEMICYSAVIHLHGKWYMFYNGNDFGRTGFGVAGLVSW